MQSLITSNLAELQSRHYVRLATSSNYWVDFAKGKLRKYISKFGDKLCLVVNGSEEIDNAYILPFHIVSPLFTESTLDPDGSGWSGTIINNIFRVHGQRIPVSPFYNAFHLLDIENIDNIADVETKEVSNGETDEIHLDDLKAIVIEFNTRYKNATPYKRLMISEQVARHAAINDYLKRFRQHTCQICHEEGFIQANNIRYSETHHIIQLHELLPGSYCSDNIVVICANCHRKLHYAHVEFILISPLKISISINGQKFEIDRNVIS